MTTAILMVGATGSGKTTLAAMLARGYNAILISSDQMRKRVTGREDDYTREKEVWTAIDEQMMANLKAGHNVLLDATHSNAKRRAERAAFCRRYGADRVIVWWVDTPLERCIAQDAARVRVAGKQDVTRRWNAIQKDPPITGKNGITWVYRVSS